MPTAVGVVTSLFQPKTLGSGKKAPAKMILTHGSETQEYKSWESVDAEIGQEVEVTYETEVRGNYTNNNILSLKVLSWPAPSERSGGGRTDAVGQSIEKQVALKVAGEIVTAFVGVGAMDADSAEEVLEQMYLAGVNLLVHGATGVAEVSK